jgi:hypothetical protein
MRKLPIASKQWDNLSATISVKKCRGKKEAVSACDLNFSGGL